MGCARGPFRLRVLSRLASFPASAHLRAIALPSPPRARRLSLPRLGHASGEHTSHAPAVLGAAPQEAAEVGQAHAELATRAAQAMGLDVPACDPPLHGPDVQTERPGQVRSVYYAAPLSHGLTIPRCHMWRLWSPATEQWANPRWSAGGSLVGRLPVAQQPVCGSCGHERQHRAAKRPIHGEYAEPGDQFGPEAGHDAPAAATGPQPQPTHDWLTDVDVPNESHAAMYPIAGDGQEEPTAVVMARVIWRNAVGRPVVPELPL